MNQGGTADRISSLTRHLALSGIFAFWRIFLKVKNEEKRREVRKDVMGSKVKSCDVMRKDVMGSKVKSCDVMRKDVMENNVKSCDVIRKNVMESKVKSCGVVRKNVMESKVKPCDVMRKMTERKALCKRSSLRRLS